MGLKKNHSFYTSVASAPRFAREFGLCLMVKEFLAGLELGHA